MDADFTAAEVSRLAGFEKPWMLSHLEREGTFVREHCTDRRHGRARKYTFADLLILRAINRLLDMGARPARIRDVIRKLGEIEQLRGTREAAVELARSLNVRLFVTKDAAHLVTNETQVVSLTEKGQLAFGFVVHLPSVATEVVEIAERYKMERRCNWKVDREFLEGLCQERGI